VVEGLLGLIFADVPVTTLEKDVLAFRCFCSREELERLLGEMQLS
jgi:redox-regulated HSP33 family molecular chaperone